MVSVTMMSVKYWVIFFGQCVCAFNCVSHGMSTCTCACVYRDAKVKQVVGFVPVSSRFAFNVLHGQLSYTISC